MVKEAGWCEARWGKGCGARWGKGCAAHLQCGRRIGAKGVRSCAGLWRAHHDEAAVAAAGAANHILAARKPDLAVEGYREVAIGAHRKRQRCRDSGSNEG